MNRGRTRWGAALAAVAALALAGLAVWIVIEYREEAKHDAEREQPPRRVSVANGETVITLDAAAQQSAGIETLALTNAPHQERVRAFGAVLDLQPLTGLANRHDRAKAQLDIANAKLTASQTAFERARKLYQDRQNISAAQLDAAEVAFRVDRAGLAAAQSELRTLAVTARQEWGPALGDAIVNEGALLGSLIARQEVLLQVTLRPGQTIAQPPTDAFVQLDGGSRAPLRFVSAATKTDPRLQGPSFFFTTPTDSGLLPGMSVLALVARGPAVEGAMLPTSAIVWEQGRTWAYFRTGEDTFARRAVATDLPTVEGDYVVQNLPDNAVVVVQGAQMLLSEEYRGQVPVED
jgi:hypothetical protein